MTGSVSNGEFKTAKDDEKWYSDGIDTRYNSMLQDNHTIMADKVVNSLLTKAPDLQVGSQQIYT